MRSYVTGKVPFDLNIFEAIGWKNVICQSLGADPRETNKLECAL